MLTIVPISSTFRRLVVRRLLPVAALAIALVITAGAGASGHRQIQLGLFGDPGRFASLTGQKTEVSHVFVNFHQGPALVRILAQTGPVPMVALVPGSYGHPVTATPEGIAKGRSDGFLFQLNAAVAAYAGSLFYVRPFPEM